MGNYYGTVHLSAPRNGYIYKRKIHCPVQGILTHARDRELSYDASEIVILSTLINHTLTNGKEHVARTYGKTSFQL